MDTAMETIKQQQLLLSDKANISQQLLVTYAYYFQKIAIERKNW